MIRHPKATYIKAEIPEYEGHPLINALPPINSPADTARLLNRFPAIDESEKKSPGHIRRHSMMRILDKFLYPTKTHLQLEQMLSGMIRRGYLSRNIANIAYQRNLDDASDTDFSTASRNAGNESLVSSVIGCSGTGKSTAVEAILHCYPQVIYHPDYQHTQLVWLKVECPHDGSVKSLCTNFFRAVDNALGTDYQQLYVKSRSSAESMLGDLARVLALHSVGLLVIDEIQHLEKSKSGGSEKMLNFFVTLTNVIKVPVLFIGTPKALDLFTPTMRSARRAAQFGSLSWNRFERSQNPEQDAEWEKFIKRLWKLQWFENPTPLSPALKDIFWEFTQGIPHIAVSLFYLCQARAVMAGREVIDVPLVKKVFDEELSLMHPMIKALQSGRKEMILKYADLDIPKEAIRSLGSYIPDDLLQDFGHEPPDDGPSEIDTMGIGLNAASKKRTQVVEVSPDEVGQREKGNSLGIKRKKPTSVVAPMKKSAAYLYSNNDLLPFRQDTPDATYKVLKRSGVIVDLTPFL